MGDTLSFDPIAEGARQWEHHWGGEPVPAMHAVTSIMRAQQILLARLNEALAPFGLTFPRYEALMLLFYSSQGSLPLGKMGARLQVHRTSLASLVAGLERSGFVRRTAHEHDGRMTLAELTPAGREAAAKATEALNAAQLHTAPLEAEQLEQLSEILGALRAAEGDF